MKVKWLANLLSASRIFFAALYVFFFQNEIYAAALASLAAAGLTDVADGAVARSFGGCSRVGVVLDPVADKILQCSVLVCLCQAGIIPVWSVIFYIVKDLILAVGAVISLLLKRIPVASAWYGKASATALFFIFMGLTASVYFEFPPPAGIICGFVLCFFAVFSLTAYAVRFFYHLQTIAIIQKGQL